MTRRALFTKVLVAPAFARLMDGGGKLPSFYLPPKPRVFHFDGQASPRIDLEAWKFWVEEFEGLKGKV